MKLNFTSVLERFEGLGTGGKAEVKRASSPEELKLSTVLYQLGFPFKEYWQREKAARIAFILPYLKDSENAGSFGKVIAFYDNHKTEGVKYSPIGKRLMRIVRLSDGHDIVEFRRLLKHLSRKNNDKKIAVDFSKEGNRLYYWNEVNKKQIFENYLINKYSKSKEKEE